MRKHTSRLLASVSLLAALGPLASEAAAPKAPYSLPWQLRPTAAVSVVRSDTSLALSSTEATSS